MARRVNKKFLIILTLVVMGTVGAALLFPWLVNRSKAAQYIAEGERCFKEGRFQEARDAYAKAIGSSRPTPDLLVRFGDVFHELARFDDDAMGKDVRQWEAALDIDPGYRPAHERVFDASLDLVEILGNADNFDRLRQKAEALLKVEPDNVHARVMTRACVIGAWLARKPTSDDDLKTAIEDLKGLQAANPQIWEIPWYIHNAALRQMQERITAGDAKSAKEFRDGALKVYDDALKAQPDSATILFRYYKFKTDLNRLPDLDVAGEDAAGKKKSLAEYVNDLLAQANALIQPGDEGRKDCVDYVTAHIDAASKLQQQGATLLQQANALQQQARLKEARATLEEANAALGGAAGSFKTLLANYLLVKANALVKPEDKDYVEIRVQMASVIQQDGKVDEAEKILKALLAERPNDQNVRLSMARLVRNLSDAQGNPRRPEAIELLSRPMGDDPSLTGFRAYFRKRQEFLRLTDLADTLWDACADVDTARTPQADSERDRIKEQINACYTRAQTLAPEQDATLLKLHGKILLLETDPRSTREAVKYLQQALDKMEQARDPNTGPLMLLLSRVYRRIGQPGKSIELLTTVVERYPGALPTRKELVELHLRAGQPEMARPHVDVLVRQLPNDDPDVMRYRVLVPYNLNKAKPSPELQKEYRAALAEFPEAKPDQQLRKAGIALAVGELAMGETLLKPLSDDELNKEGKGPFSASELLSRLYFTQGKDDPRDDAAKRAAAAAKRADASRIAAACLAKNPADSTFTLLAKLFDGKLTKEEIERLQNEEIGRIEDPVTQAMQRYRMAHDKRQLDEALNILLDAEKKTNGQGDILENIFDHAVETKNWALAKTYADKLGKLNWDDADGLYYRTRLLLAQNEDTNGATEAELKEKRQAALASAEALTRQIPQISRSWLLLGQAQQALGQIDAAIASYGKVRDRELYNIQAMIGLIDCYLGQRQLKLAQDAGEANRLLKLAQDIIEAGRRSAMRETAATFVEIGKRVQEQVLDPADPDSVKAFDAVTLQRENDLEARARDIEARAKELTAAGNDPKEIALLMQDPGLLKNYLALIDNYNRAIDKKGVADAASQAQKAGVRIDEAIKRWPDELAVYARLRELSDLTSQREQGVKVIQQLLERDKWKDRYEPRLLLALLYQHMGPKSLADAEQAYQQAISVSKNDSDPRVRLYVRQQLARFYIQTKQVDKAVALLSQLADESKDLFYRRQAIQVLLANDKADDAEKMLSAALASSPSDTPLISLMAYVKVSRRQYDGPGGAKELVDKLLTADPQNPTALWYRGMIHLGSGELQEALADLQHANDLSPANPDILLQLANAYIQRHQTDDAIKTLEGAVRLAPTDKQARLRLLQLYRDQERWAAVENTLKDAQANPDLKGDVGWLKLESDMWVARKDYDKAIKALMEASRREPGNEDVGYALLELLRSLKQYDTIIAICDNVPAADRPWWIHMNRGVALVGKNGKSKEAEGEFDLALTGVDAAEDDLGAAALVETMANTLGLQATSDRIAARVKPRWLLQRAVLHLTRHDWPSASAAADQVLAEGFPQYTPAQRFTALKTAGQIYIAAAAAHVPDAGKKGAKAYKDYLDEVQKQRLGIASQLEALNNIAYLYAEQTDPPDYVQALVYSQKAYDLMERANFLDPNIGDTHGWILVLSSRLDEGMQILQQVVGKDTAPPDAFYHLGRAYLKKSQPDDAQSNFRRALEIIETKTKKNPPEFVDPGLKDLITKAQEEARQMKPAMGEAR